MITLVLARADNGVIGRDGGLPWRLPADLRRFKALTLGKPMIMGRKTFDGFSAPLPGRRHVVLTRDPAWRADGAEVAHSVEDALALAGGDVSVIGGAEVFALFLPLADRIELTEVRAEVDGDTVVPPFEGWREAGREDHPAEGNAPAYSFVTLVRRYLPGTGRGTATRSGVVEGSRRHDGLRRRPLHPSPAASGPPPRPGEVWICSPRP